MYLLGVGAFFSRWPHLFARQGDRYNVYLALGAYQEIGAKKGRRSMKKAPEGGAWLVFFSLPSSICLSIYLAPLPLYSFPLTYFLTVSSF